MVKGVKGSGFIQCVLCRVHSVCRVYGETVHVDGDLVRCLVPDPRCVPPLLLGACRQGMSALVSALRVNPSGSEKSLHDDLVPPRKSVGQSGPLET